MYRKKPSVLREQEAACVSFPVLAAGERKAGALRREVLGSGGSWWTAACLMGWPQQWAGEVGAGAGLKGPFC